MDNDVAPFDYLSLVSSGIICVLFSIGYILILYIFSPSNQRFNRNQSNVILRRFVAISILCLLIYLFLKNHSNTNININDWLGFRTNICSIWKLIFYPMLLTCLLFTGPILQWIVFREWEDLSFNFSFNEKMIFLRNYLVAPFTEEFVFRSSMLCVLYSHVTLFSALFYSPLFFGLAHFHHMLEHVYRNRCEKPTHRITVFNIFLMHLFQFSYTYIFGVYSSFLFIRTGHFLPSFLAHSLCNSLGVPDIRSVRNCSNQYQKYFLIISYFLGVFLFATNLYGLTQSKFYFYNNSISMIYRHWSNSL